MAGISREDLVTSWDISKNLIIEEITWSMCIECDDCTSILFFSLHVGISRAKFLKEGRL